MKLLRYVFYLLLLKTIKVLVFCSLIFLASPKDSLDVLSMAGFEASLVELDDSQCSVGISSLALDDSQCSVDISSVALDDSQCSVDISSVVLDDFQDSVDISSLALDDFQDSVELFSISGFEASLVERDDSQCSVGISSLALDDSQDSVEFLSMAGFEASLIERDDSQCLLGISSVALAGSKDLSELLLIDKKIEPLDFLDIFLMTRMDESEYSLNVSDLENSVYRIFGPDLEIQGTAFAIAPSLFITNFHIIDDLSKGDQILLSNKKGEELVFHEAIQLSPLLDLALFETYGSASSYLELAENSILSRDSSSYQFVPGWIGKKLTLDKELIIMGYPGNQFSYIKMVGKEIFETPKDYLIPIDHPSGVYGGSGSPILNHKSRVVAVLYATTGIHSKTLLGFETLSSSHYIYAKKFDSESDFLTGNKGVPCRESESLKSCINRAKIYEPKKNWPWDNLYPKNPHWDSLSP